MAETNRMRCPKCGADMNHHADKVDYGAGAAQPGGSITTASTLIQQAEAACKAGDAKTAKAKAEAAIAILK